LADAAASSLSSSPRRLPQNQMRDDNAAADNFGLSPEKLLTPFKKRKSDNDSVATGDDSDGWEREEERVMARLAAQLIADEALDEAADDSEPFNLIEEWEYLAEEAAIDDDESPPLAATEATVDVLVEFKKVKVPNLREIAIKMNVSQTGANKRLLFDRIMASGGVTKIDENSFKYSRLIAASAVGGTTKLPTWVDLMPQPIPQIDGVDMATGATVGFFGPTNKENVAGVERHNFLIGEEIERLIFGPKRKKARVGDETAPTPPVRNDGHPSDAAKSIIGDIWLSRPKDYFDLQMNKKLFKIMTDATNLRVAADGAGSGRGEYKDFVPFDVDEMYKMVGVLFANGLAPKPRLEYWFEPTSKLPLFGSNLISKVTEKRIRLMGRMIRGSRRWRHFRRFLSISDFRADATKEQEKDPLWKVWILIDHLNKMRRTCGSLANG
jgi:hypothetical protein